MSEIVSHFVKFRLTTKKLFLRICDWRIENFQFSASETKKRKRFQFKSFVGSTYFIISRALANALRERLSLCTYIHISIFPLVCLSLCVILLEIRTDGRNLGEIPKYFFRPRFLSFFLSFSLSLPSLVVYSLTDLMSSFPNAVFPSRDRRLNCLLHTFDSRGISILGIK